ncbi:MAG TPA: hypothetical protein VMB02_13070 [Candidatus Aquilonibacter sp.]|nr:hypothetical protein [Candidatus Aquilonibacter sp.]
MKAVEIFDACHARYRGLRDWLQDSSSSVRALGLDKPSSGYQWRPDRTRACEYIADFERIGRHTLRRPEWKGRLRLFNAYFVRGVDYKGAVRLVGVSEGTFDYWFREVKRALGTEFSRTGLFPPARYFRSRGLAPAERLVSSVFSPARTSQEVPHQRDSQSEGNVQQIP